MWVLIREASVARNLRALAPARRTSSARSGSRSAPTTASPSTSPRTATSTDRARGRRTRRSRRRTRSSWPPTTRRRGTGSTTWVRSRPATRPTSCSCPISSASVPTLVLKAGRPLGGDPEGRPCPSGCSARFGSRRSRLEGLPRSLAGREGARDRAGSRPDHHRARSSRSRRSPTASRWPTLSATWPRWPSSSATTAPAGSGSASSAASACKRGALRLDCRARRAQHRRRRASTTATWRARSSGWRSSAAAWSSSRASGVRAELPLPVAGLLAEAPAAEVVERAAPAWPPPRLGCTIEAPFQALAFLACR